MKRTDLHQDPAKSLGKLLKGARGVGEAAHTRPTGTLHLGDGDAVWDTPEGLRSVKDLPSAIDVEKLLQEGLATESRRTTVSTSAPSVTEGFPAGAWWTQTTSAEDNTVTGVWRLVDGEWVAQDLPSDDLTAFPFADIGLLNVAVLSAQIITSGYFRTAVTGKRIEVDSLGVRAYNASGDNTVNINGSDNLMTGGIRTAASGRRTEILNVIWGGLWSGIRLYPQETTRPVEIKTAPFAWKDYPGGALYLTSAADSVSRGELVVANDRFNLNFEDQSTGAQKRYIEVTRGGDANLRADRGAELSGTTRAALRIPPATGGYSNEVSVSGTTALIAGETVQVIGRSGIQLLTTAAGAPVTINGSPVVFAPTQPSGQLSDIRTPGRWEIQHTNTPSGTWGFLDVVETGDGVVEHRFTSDTQGDWREWRRRSTSTTAWGPWALVSGGPVTNRTSFVDWNFSDGQTARINYDLGGTPAGMSWDSNNRQLIVSQAGRYEVSFMATADTAGPNGWFARMQISGTNVAAPQRYGRGTSNHTITRPIAAGGTVSIEIANFSGGALRIIKNADLTLLDVTYVGP